MAGYSEVLPSYSYTRIKFKAAITSNGLFWIFGAKPDCVAKIIRYRQLRAIDFYVLRQDVEKSQLQ